MVDVIFLAIENEEQRSELAEFYSINKNRLFYTALSILHNRSDAEDAIQEVFKEIVDKSVNFFGIAPENRLAYTSIIVKNISVNMLNAKNKISTEQIDKDSTSFELSLENALFDKIARDEVVSFVNGLPTMQRSVLTLHCFFDLSIDETARRLNISLSTANKHLSLARRAVRKFIDERKRRA